MKLDPSAILEGFSAVQRETVRHYEALLRDRAVRVGLVSAGDSSRLGERHILDSLRGLACLGEEGGPILDLGSGAGLPGVPMAVARPDRAFILVERKSRAAAFLELAVEELSLTNVTVFPGPIESYASTASVCLSRALAPADRAWRLAGPLLDADGRLIYWAGKGWTPSQAKRPAAVSAEICAPGWFSWQGPLVIMKRSPISPLKERTDES